MKPDKLFFDKLMNRLSARDSSIFFTRDEFREWYTLYLRPWAFELWEDHLSDECIWGEVFAKEVIYLPYDKLFNNESYFATFTEFKNAYLKLWE